MQGRTKSIQEFVNNMKKLTSVDVIHEASPAGMRDYIRKNKNKIETIIVIKKD